jgi:hypothetical protein
MLLLPLLLVLFLPAAGSSSIELVLHIDEDPVVAAT